ncbi:deoxyribodipyrimidine photo-lyase [Glutamicibacter sp. BW77]|uniref:cryptochrome/photolyase family protein n=1 Tax=Glutamicibacter TaxID=1742989 RepID=UPI000BB71172|nr:deoxyribodipyrimidine photo-lyase [Glutamicibacter sp. BW77]PCC36865.1 deoxyribodipyrimidine photolyase [Glutamicibacter sp. BW77]
MSHRPQAVQLVLFRDDLRTVDHPALHAARDAGDTVALYILDEQSPGIRPLGGAARWWLHQALLSLRDSLDDLGIPLILRRGPAARILAELSQDGNLDAVHWNRRYGEAERAVDAQLKLQLRGDGITVHSYAAALLHEPWELLTQNGTGYKVFTPFYNSLRAQELRPPLPAPAPQQRQGFPLPPSESLDDWKLLPTTPDWSEGLAATWTPGEPAAQERLAETLSSIAQDYAEHHDRPDLDGTSALSPALRWGHLSAHQVWDELSKYAAHSPGAAQGAAAMRRQVAWRDFCWHLYYHHPQLPTENLRSEFDDFAWAWPADGKEVAEKVACWQRGRTGFGLVDAGMAQLWHTGWMHNRVRMVTASLLVKNLAVHWKVGEQWFWDTLVDADVACNSANWQWVAGSGADASPYFRVFNPELQAKKFDPRGSYVARYAPLAAEPLVDLKESREQALEAYSEMKLRQGK